MLAAAANAADNDRMDDGGVRLLLPLLPLPPLPGVSGGLRLSIGTFCNDRGDTIAAISVPVATSGAVMPLVLMFILVLISRDNEGDADDTGSTLTNPSSITVIIGNSNGSVA